MHLAPTISTQKNIKVYSAVSEKQLENDAAIGKITVAIRNHYQKANAFDLFKQFQS